MQFSSQAKQNEASSKFNELVSSVNLKTSIVSWRIVLKISYGTTIMHSDGNDTKGEEGKQESKRQEGIEDEENGRRRKKVASTDQD